MLTIEMIYRSCPDIEAFTSVIIYPSYGALVTGTNGKVFGDIGDLPYAKYARTDVIGFRIIDGNIHVALGGEW